MRDKVSDNPRGLFKRSLPAYAEDLYVHLPKDDYKDLEELIDDWGLLYCGEPNIDERQVLDFMTERHLTTETYAAKLLRKRGRMELRQALLNELYKRTLKQMSPNVRTTCIILYRANLIDLGL